jgi:hypothetical protein
MPARQYNSLLMKRQCARPWKLKESKDGWCKECSFCCEAREHAAFEAHCERVKKDNKVLWLKRRAAELRVQMWRVKVARLRGPYWRAVDAVLVRMLLGLHVANSASNDGEDSNHGGDEEERAE